MSQAPVTRVNGGVARDDRLRQLRAMLERYQHRRRGGTRPVVPTGLARLDRALPNGGLPGGAVTEILSHLDGAGGTTLALRAAVAAAQSGRAVAVVDAGGDFYPPAMWRLGMQVDRLLVIRVSRPEEVVWAVDQCLRCSAVAAVVAPIRRLDAAASRRLQLAAESGGGLGILLRPDTGRRHSFAAVQMRVEPVPVEAPGSVALQDRGLGAAGVDGWESAGLQGGVIEGRCESVRRGGMGPSHSAPRLCRVTLMKVREGTPVEPFVIGLDDETGVEPLLPVPDHRPAERPQRSDRRISA
ncbi:MAG TPA: hypothetical protein VM243_04290 [Phycisphaerae bacterium]|nr:hypothetical protein [Phycisphaerae bacterium]